MALSATVQKPNILVAPLDWGLGHATRCIPVVRALLAQNCNVVLAGEGNIKNLLEKEFPQLQFLPLPGYNVRYARRGKMLPLVMAAQVPKLLSSIKKEHAWLQDAAQEHRLSGIISDNRYGLFHPSLPSVMITHQLCIKTNLGTPGDRFLQRLHYRFINRFAACWVPDHPALPGLAGTLSHSPYLPRIPVHYTGPLSRFAARGKKKEQHLLVLLSGPEPQRTILEALVLPQLKSLEGPVVLVRGLPGQTVVLQVPPHVSVYNHLPATELQDKMEHASFVVSRCGYSTVMDLAALRVKSILVPTPGQTEQEYLGRHLMQQGLALSVEQAKFRLGPALDLAATFPYRIHEESRSPLLERVVERWVGELKAVG